MRLSVLAFLAGVVSLHTLSALPSFWWISGLLPLIALILWPPLPYLYLPAWALAGFLWALLWAAPSASLQLPTELVGVDLQVEGWIASIPESFYRSNRFEFSVDKLRHESKSIPFRGKLRLSWYETPAPKLKVGERWRFTVRLRRPRSFSNPGGFDYERWLYLSHIHALGSVRLTPDAPERLAINERYAVDRLRQNLFGQFNALLGEQRYRGILTALAIGDRQAISNDQWQVFARTGTSHLMAISGLHVGLIAGFLFFLVRALWSCLPALALRWPAPKAAAIAALLGATGYALLAGFSLPTQRAWLMLAVTLLAVLWQRPLVSSRLLAWALLLVLIVDPTAPLSGGFWLSFGAVAVILYSMVGRGQAHSPLFRWLGLQFVLLLALAPATLSLFQTLPVLAPFANLIAIPWVSVTVVPFTLLAVLAGMFNTSLQLMLLNLAARSMDILWQYLEWLSRSPLAQLDWPAPPSWSLLFALPGLLLLLAPRGLPSRWLALPLCLPLAFPLTNSLAPGTARFTLLDVGQGLAAVVRTSEHVLVYDTGPRLGSSFDAGRAALVPFLRSQGISRIDTLIVSHADSQHTGGIRSLREQFPINRILTSSLAAAPIGGAETCHRGDSWTWDKIEFHILHPPNNSYSSDNASCVLLVSAGDKRLLLPGDIEARAEKALLTDITAFSPIDIMVAPHHGHRAKSLPEFISLAQPIYVLFATGYNNRFGYPKPETEVLYRHSGAEILNTSELGAITFELAVNQALQLDAHRPRMRRYWHTP